MHRVLVVLFIVFSFSINLFSDDLSKLNDFDKNYKTVSNDKLLDYHHMLKNLYITSIVNNDTKLKIQTLKRLILSSKALGLNSHVYQKELKTLSKDEKDIIFPKITKNKTTNKHAKIPTFKDFLNDKESSHESKAKLIDLILSQESIILRFDQSIQEAKIKHFVLKSNKTYRYVCDVPQSFLSKNKSLKTKYLDKITISQYNPNTTRIVITSDKVFHLDYIKSDEQLKIDFHKMIYQKSDTKADKAVKTATKPANKTPSKTLKKGFNPKNKIIVIDAGHGGKDGGAQGGRNLSEKTLTLSTALQIGKELKKRGFKVYFTRNKDVFIPLRDRTKYANNKNADLFISIHANAAPKGKQEKAHGLETFFLSPARSERSQKVAAQENSADMTAMQYFSKKTFLDFLNRNKIIEANKLSIDVQRGMLSSIRKKFKVVDGGVREAPFWVLVGAQMPAILIEMGYITHPEEGPRLANKNYQILLAKGISDGISNYFLNKNK